MSLKEIAPYIKNEYIKKIYKKYPDIEDIYNNNPYSLLDLEEFGCDQDENAPTFIDIDRNTILNSFDLRLKEMKAAITYILQINEQVGNSWIKYEELNNKVFNLLRYTKHPLLKGKTIMPYLNYYKNIFFYDKKRDIITLTKTKNKEFLIYTGIKSAKKNKIDLSNYRPIDITNMLSTTQMASAKNVILEGGNISLLTGGPGTGKTTITKAMVRGLKESYPNKKIVLLAPTGKATNRIKDIFPSEDIEIETIHLFLGWGVEGRKIKEIKDNVLSTDIIFIDESSMINVDILSRLFEFVNIATTKIIFIGDSDQLSAIGVGDTINDLRKLNVYEEHLSINYRSNLAIDKNSKNLNQGIFALETDETFEFYDINNCIAKELLAKEMATTKNNEILLTPFRKESIIGNTIELNKLAHNERYGENRKDFINGWCKGEKVVFTHTNYKRHYFNGDTGILDSPCRVKEKGEYVEAFRVILSNGDIVKVIDEDDIELAYALTIHKSQGSEYDIVNIYIPEYKSFITREMLYTAITRAKKKVRLWTTMDIYKKICLSETKQRNTMISLWNNPLMVA